VILSAGTGFGKTFLFSNILINNLNEKNKKLFLVPTELLEDQIIMRLTKMKVDVSNEVGLSRIIVCTPEKIAYFLSEQPEYFDEIVVDEAHIILNKNDERSLFLANLIRQVALNSKGLKIHFISPFIKQEEFEIFLQDSGLDINTIKFLSIKNNKINKKMVTKIGNIGLEIRTPLEDVFNVIQPSIEGKNKPEDVTLTYFPSVDKLRKYISENQKSILQKVIVPEILERIKIDCEGFKNYFLIDMILRGECYLHSHIPSKIKLKIIELIELGLITEIYSSPIITNGIDLPFTKLIIRETRVSSEIMGVKDFINLVGRVGRQNQSKRTTNYGFVFIEQNSTNDQ
jgi:replicative superfamily II helicase